MAKENKANMGKTKRSTDDLIDSAISKQNDWLENRRAYTRSFLKKLNVFSKQKTEPQPVVENKQKNQRSVLLGYWFPILCALIVVFIAIWVAFIRVNNNSRIVLVPEVNVPVVEKKQEVTIPEFDIVRIEKEGNVVIAGRWMPHKNISVMVNGRIIATEQTNFDGEFVYSTQKAWDAGNYTIVLVGNDPEIMRMACENEALAPFPIIDINMGCPVPKIYKNGEGSALLENPALAEKIVKECMKSGKIITVKFRIGITDEQLITQEFAKRMEGAGASLITIHGRTKEKVYAGDVNYREISAAKNAVKIPVIANGGVFSNADAEKLLSETGADGVMVARASLFDPQIFCELTGAERENCLTMFKKQLAWTQQVCDERFTTVFMRKMAAFYIKGMRGSAAYKDRLFQAQSPSEILAIAEEMWASENA